MFEMSPATRKDAAPCTIDSRVLLFVCGGFGVRDLSHYQIIYFSNFVSLIRTTLTFISIYDYRRDCR